MVWQQASVTVGWCGAAGAQRLKEALEAEGLKAGGTLRQRAERLMLLRDTPRDKLDRKHFAKGIIPQARGSVPWHVSRVAVHRVWVHSQPLLFRADLALGV